MTGPARAITREKWSRQGAEAIAGSDGRIMTADPSTYRSRGRRWTFGDVVISDSIQTPCHIAPTYDDANGDHYVTVFFVLSGAYTLFAEGESIDFERGAAGWMPGLTGVAAENRDVSRLARVSVPRISLRGADKRQPSTGIFSPLLSLTTPALSFVLELMNTADERSTSGIIMPGRTELLDADVTGAVLSQLVTGLFLEQTQLHVDSLESTASLWAQAAGIIDDEYSDTLLDPATLAERLHVSLRHLQRAFAQHQTTISDAIRERRAAAVVEILSGALDTDIPLSDVAGHCGFTSIKEMRFALRSKYAITPRELRAAAHSASRSAGQWLQDDHG